MTGSGNELIGCEELMHVAEVIRSGHIFRNGDLTDPNYKMLL